MHWCTHTYSLGEEEEQGHQRTGGDSQLQASARGTCLYGAFMPNACVLMENMYEYQHSFLITLGTYFFRKNGLFSLWVKQQ